MVLEFRPLSGAGAMRRIVCLLGGVLVVVPSLGSDSPKGYGDAAEPDELQGTWALVLQVYDNRQATGPAVDGSEVETFRAGRWEKGAPERSVNYRADAGLRPAHLDAPFPSGHRQRGMMRYIYRRDGDTLRIAFGDDLSIRPRSFDEQGIFVSTYKRVK
jgi:uncharacterized protein (TIGR03067 family)